MFYLFLTDFVDTTLATQTFVFGSTPRVCKSIGIMDDDEFEGEETFQAMLVEHTDTANIVGYDLTLGNNREMFTITDRNGKYTSCPASQLVRNTCNIGI